MLIFSIDQIWFGFEAGFLVLIFARVKSLCSILFSFSMEAYLWKIVPLMLLFLGLKHHINGNFL